MPIELDIQPPRIEAIRCDLLDSRDVVLNVLRLDAIHPVNLEAESASGFQFFPDEDDWPEGDIDGLLGCRL